MLTFNRSVNDPLAQSGHPEKRTIKKYRHHREGEQS